MTFKEEFYKEYPSLSDDFVIFKEYFTEDNGTVIMEVDDFKKYLLDKQKVKDAWNKCKSRLDDGGRYTFTQCFVEFERVLEL